MTKGQLKNDGDIQIQTFPVHLGEQHGEAGLQGTGLAPNDLLHCQGLSSAFHWSYCAPTNSAAKYTDLARSSKELGSTPQ